MIGNLPLRLDQGRRWEVAFEDLADADIADGCEFDAEADDDSDDEGGNKHFEDSGGGKVIPVGFDDIYDSDSTTSDEGNMK